MSEAEDSLTQLMQSEVRDGILYKCFCAEFEVRDLTPDEMWEMFDVRWAALSETRLDKGLETFLMRDEADSAPSTIQIAALDPAGHAIGGRRRCPVGRRRSFGARRRPLSIRPVLIGGTRQP